MKDTQKSREDSTLASRRTVIAGVSASVGGVAIPAAGGFSATEEISHSAESIHQVVHLSATPERVYRALTDAEQFQKVMALSAAVTSGMVKASSPAQISREAGGPFVVFGGVISGRIIELLPNERIVQAWRAADWAPGIYSIARFELRADGNGTRLTFDHTGFPAGAAEHLAAGWKGNYWEPLNKLLG